MEKDQEIANGFDNKEGKREFGLLFSIMLCIYFCVLFRTAILMFSQLFKEYLPDVLNGDYVIYGMLWGIIYVLWATFGFYAIILVLKGSTGSITCLKLSTPCIIPIFVLFLGTKLVMLGLFAKILFFAILLFLVLFFIYLFKSKQIKANFTPEQRGFGIAGAIGVLPYLFGAAMLSYSLVLSIGFVWRGQAMDVNKIYLNAGELTDGRIIFTPLEGWVSDSVSTHSDSSVVYYFSDPRIGTAVRITGTKEESVPSRHSYIKSIYENQILEPIYFVEEVGHNTIETKNDVIYLDQYLYLRDSSYYYWTYAAKLGKKAGKSIRVSIIEKDTLKTSAYEAERFLNNASLDLKSRLLKKHRINNVNNGNDDD